MREFFEMFMDPWDWISIEKLDAREVGDELVLQVRFRAHSHEGVDVDMVLGQRYLMRDGRLVRFHGHPSFEAALEAAGVGT